uniref:Uncharacterized protein n=1 Tax=Pyrodinium bahamense TaxID=73915 RepID=A0A7S0FMJ9_9DINO|mmetsp:Transcript_38163/g.106267  ORF Transcript_38163/g.106267 Transcript_38163/m.106267 type:complete len:267 (+) Transcript_38163:86-886(+)
MCVGPSEAPEAIEDRQFGARPGAAELVCAGSPKMADAEVELPAAGRPEGEARFGRGARRQYLRPLEELRRDFERRRAGRFRPLKELTLDFERRQAARRRALGGPAQEDLKQHHGESHGEVTQAPPKLPTYGRAQLLAVIGAMGEASAEANRGALGISVLRVPSLAAGAARPARPSQYTEDPRLDDTRIVARIEARLSRESGANSRNAETFGGDCGAGWTFAEALRANRALQELEGCASTAAGSEPSERASEIGTSDCEDSTWACMS